jgi:hypothetical protein
MGEESGCREGEERGEALLIPLSGDTAAAAATPPAATPPSSRPVPPYPST